MAPVKLNDIEKYLPKPGDIVIARRTMRAWENDEERGFNGMVISPGEMGIIVQRWNVGNQMRMRLLVNDKLVLFSCKEYVATLNWSFSPSSDQ